MGKPLCAQSCYGPRLCWEPTEVYTNRVWHSTSAARMTLTRCVSAGSSEAWWLRSAAAGRCKGTRRSCATQLCRILCSLESVRGTLQKLSRGKDTRTDTLLLLSTFCFTLPDDFTDWHIFTDKDLTIGLLLKIS